MENETGIKLQFKEQRNFGKKTLPLVEGSSTYRGYPGQANLSDISLQSVASRVREKQNVFSARRVTLL